MQLDYNVDKKKLKEVFRLAGKVQRVELSLDKDGRSRGFAIVEYDHPVESVQAISMFHNQQLFDRVMTVRMDRANETVKLPEGLKGIGMGLGLNGEPLKDVARNLPSTNSSSNNSAPITTGAGLLGAVPTPALQMGITNAAAALSGLGSSNLGSLSSTNAVLQAANLAAGVGGLNSGLLGGGIGGADLGLASGLVNNGLVQNPSFAALTASSGNLGNNANTQFGRNDSSGGYGSQNSNYQNPTPQGQGYGSGGGRMYQNDSPKTGGYNFSGNTEREVRATPVFANANNSGQIIRSGNAMNKNSSFSNKIIISNVSR